MSETRRIRNGVAMLRAWEEVSNLPAEKASQRLVGAFMQVDRRNGDPHDLRSTVVDMMTDLCHYAVSEGIAIGPVIEKARAIPAGAKAPQGLTAEQIPAILSRLAHSIAPKGHDPENTFWSVENHIGAEAPHAPDDEHAGGMTP